MIDTSKDKLKTCICLFTCITTLALYLEVVYNFTAQKFLNAFKRFLARRGKKEQIFSDNATKFKFAKQGLVNVGRTYVYLRTVSIIFPVKIFKGDFIIEYGRMDFT